MKKITLITISLVLLFSMQVFAAGKKEALVYGGSSTVAPIANMALETFNKANTETEVSYETLGSSTGIKQLLAGNLKMAGSSRDLKPAEIEKGARFETIALDGLSVAINKSVALKNISKADLASVFSGEITNWKELGGPDAKIELIVRDETSGTYASFKEIILDEAKKEISKNAIVARENGELAAKISSTPNSIGYIGMAFNHIITEAGGHILKVDNVAPTKSSIISGEYPISRKLYLVYTGELTGTNKKFVDYILSKEGQEIVQQNSFIPIK